MKALPPSGWYPDPEDAPQMRYWDGSQWTEHRTQPDPQTSQTAPASTSLTAPVPSRQPNHIGEDRSGTKIPLFGARKHARDTAEKLGRAQAEIARLHADMDRLGVLELADLERRREELKTEINAMRSELTSMKAALQ